MAKNIGQAPQGILERALTENVFVSNSLAYMNEGDKDVYNVYKYDIKNILRPRSDNPAASISNTQQDQAFNRSLTVVESMHSFNPASFYNYWKDYQPAGEFQWEGLPSNVQATLENLFLGSAAEATENALTNGDALTGIVGLVPQLLSSALIPLAGADATPTQVVNNTAISFRAHGGGTAGTDEEGVVLTAQNIFPKLELLIKNQSKSMRKRSGKKFMISHGTADLLREAQRLELNFKGVDVTEAGVLRYAGYDLIENPSFPDNTILFCNMTGDIKTDAIQMGTSMSSDFNNLEVQRLNNFNRVWGMCLTFALDIFVVRPEEVCFYTTETVI